MTARLLLVALWCAWLPCMLVAGSPAAANGGPTEAAGVAAADHPHHAPPEAPPAPPHESAPPASHHECVMMPGALALRAVPDALPSPQALLALGVSLAAPDAGGVLELAAGEGASAATRRALLQVFLN